MTDDKVKHGHEHQHDESQALDAAELNQDLELKDAEDADAVTGGVIHVKLDKTD